MGSPFQMIKFSRHLRMQRTNFFAKRMIMYMIIQEKRDTRREEIHITSIFLHEMSFFVNA